MIDTDKYEGTWKFYGMDYWKRRYEGGCEADTNLIHDAPLILEAYKRLRAELDHERNADSGSVSNERIWEQIDIDNRLAAQLVRERLGIEVKETEGEGGYVKYPSPGCGLDSETGRFNMENHEWVNATERPWLDAVVAEVKRLREWKKLVSDIVQQQDGSHLREMLKEMIE